jgi:hypothetical protein
MSRLLAARQHVKAMHVSSVTAPGVIRSSRTIPVDQSTEEHNWVISIAEQPDLLQETYREAAPVAM